MILTITLDDNNTFDIKLLDNEFVYQWADTVVNYTLRETEHTMICTVGDEHSESLFRAQLQNLFDEMQRIPDVLGVNIPSEFKITQESYNFQNTFDIQDQMNKIHRWVVSTSHQVPYEIDNTDAITAVQQDASIIAVDGLIWKINKLVHEVESTYVRPNAPNWNCGYHVYWDQDFVFDNPVDARFFWNTSNNDLLTTQTHDIWLAKRILGKDHREAWIDNDDPTAYDVTNIDQMVGYAFEVDPLTDVNKFYNSTQFKNYLQQYNVSDSNQVIGRVPLGNIVNKQNYDWEYIMSNNRIISITIK